MKKSLVAVDRHNTPLLSNCSVNNPEGTIGESRGLKLGPGAIEGIAVVATLAVVAIAVGAFFALINNEKMLALFKR
jgi:hypothetical protein